MFKIYDGREHFYQWDLDRKLIVEDEAISQVHFCNKTGDSSLVVEVYELKGQRIVNVPNILLQNSWRICVYAYDNNYTKHMERFEVVARSKPQSYVYTETEVLNFNEILELLENIENDIGAVIEEYLEENPIEVDVDLTDYYTKEEANKAIDDAVGAIEFPEDVDLSNYYTKTEVDEKIANADVDVNLDDYATKKYVDEAIGAIELKEGPQGPQGIQGPAGKDGADGANGKDGVDGKDGADGYTPIKGTDYWTEADKAAMVADVIAALPVYDGEVI